MFYLVETQIIRGNNIDNFKWLIYLENPDLAKKTIYNHFASYGNSLAIIFKTFREATREEITKYVMDEDDYFANPFPLTTNDEPYFIVCSII